MSTLDWAIGVRCSRAEICASMSWQGRDSSAAWTHRCRKFHLTPDNGRHKNFAYVTDYTETPETKRAERPTENDARKMD